MEKKQVFELIRNGFPATEIGLQSYEKQKMLNKAKDEISKLRAWFVKYDNKVMEHMRCQRLNETCHHNIIELDAQAKIYQERLNELKNILSKGG